MDRAIAQKDITNILDGLVFHAGWMGTADNIDIVRQRHLLQRFYENIRVLGDLRNRFFQLQSLLFRRQ